MALSVAGGRERFFALDEVKKVAVRIFEKYEAIALICIRLAFELCSLLGELIASLVEIFHCNRDVPHARGTHTGRWSFAFCRNNFDQVSVPGFDKVVAGVFVTDLKIQRGDIPIGKPPRVWRCDRKMLDTFKHLWGF